MERAMTGLNLGPGGVEGPGGIHTGSLDPGTGGVRDTYKPNLGSIASQAQYTEEIERDARAGKRRLLVRFLTALRRSVWGE